MHCSEYLTKEHTSGELTCSHGVLQSAVMQSAVMHPDKKQVTPVMPEAMVNKDGTTKQDCEFDASKRFIANFRTAHPRQTFMLCGDGLMSNQPLIEETLAGGMHYLFVAKPGNHKYLVEWLNAYDALPNTQWKRTNDKGELVSISVQK